MTCRGRSGTAHTPKAVHCCIITALPAATTVTIQPGTPRRPPPDTVKAVCRQLAHNAGCVQTDGMRKRAWNTSSYPPAAHMCHDAPLVLCLFSMPGWPLATQMAVWWCGMSGRHVLQHVWRRSPQHETSCATTGPAPAAMVGALPGAPAACSLRAKGAQGAAGCHRWRG